MNPKIFKAYDVRGIYPDDLDEDSAYRIGKAFVKFLNCKNVVVARDMRESSDQLFENLVKGIIDMGADVIDVGLVTSPMLYFTVGNYNYDSGIIITASHNPGNYNGFKLSKENVIPIGKNNGMDKIKELAFSEISVLDRKGSVIKKDIKQDYLNFLKKYSDGIKPLKIVIDAANAMGSITAKDVIAMTPCTLVPLFFELDGSFPNHEANPLKVETLDVLSKTVVKEGADLGAAYDGDADRVGFVDEKGEVITGDMITALLGCELLRDNPGATILYDLRSSWSTKEAIEEAGGKAVQCRVGHAFIKKQLREEGGLLGGELSSHYYFKANFCTECSDLVVLMLLKMISREGKPISEIVKPLKRYFASGEINSEVEDKEAVMKKLEEKYKTGKEIYFLDGISIEFDDWWFNVRPSNTEPLLRLNLEAKSKELMEQKRDEVLDLIRG